MQFSLNKNKQYPRTTTMSSSRDRVEDTYESQNDQRLDELHSKIRTLRGVRPIPSPFAAFSKRRNRLPPTYTTTWSARISCWMIQSARHIHVYIQYLSRVIQGDRFNSFGASLAQTTRRAGQAFGIGEGGLKTWRIALFVVGFFISFLIVRKVFSLWRGDGTA